MKFFSKHPNYMILYRPENRQFASDGTKIVLEGIKYLQFNNCMYETNDVDECVYLLKSNAYGRDIYSDIQISQIMDGTWIKELSKYIQTPAAIPDSEIDRIKKEIANRPVPKIETHVTQQEQATIETIKANPTPVKV